MTEIRDTFRDAEIETRGRRGMGRGTAIPIRLGGLGECHKLPQVSVSGAEPRPKMDLVHFELNRTHL